MTLENHRFSIGNTSTHEHGGFFSQAFVRSRYPKIYQKVDLVGGFEPTHLKNMRVRRQIGSFLQGSRWKWSNLWNYQPDIRKLMVGSGYTPQVQRTEPKKDGFPKPESPNFQGAIFRFHVSHEKKTLFTFHYTGWLIGILIMGYYNPYNWVV